MEHPKEYLDKFFQAVMKRFDAIERTLERLSRARDVMEGDELLDNQDVCLLLGITHRTLQRYKRSKLLPYRKAKGKSYYRKSDVLALLKEVK